MIEPRPFLVADSSAADPDLELEVEILEITPEAEDVVSLLLRSADGQNLPAWSPGAHIDLLLKPDLERQYSLCGDPIDRRRWRVAVLRERGGRGGSTFIHDELAVGDTIRVRGPRNHFKLVDGDAFIFIAGGIGITPLLPMIDAVDRAGRLWELLYGGRRRSSMAFVDRLAQFGKRVTIWPEDEYGLLDLPGLLDVPRVGTVVYCCGPEPLIAAVEDRCLVWPREVLHVERFKPRANVFAPGAAFEVVLDRSGVTLTVGSEQTIIEVLESAGIDVPTSCREGTCGTCETEVLEGVPDHRDAFLTEEERADNTVMMVCCGRSLTPRLVLDL